ncbi:hypothetical protein LINPERHAP2_LOCUS29489 [Linum perenne]
MVGETPIHVFRDCMVARECWADLQDGEQIRRSTIGVNFTDWFLPLCKSNGGELARKAGLIMWQIWQERNARVWKQTSRPPFIIVKQGLEDLEAWKKARRPRRMEVRSKRDGAVGKFLMKTLQGCYSAKEGEAMALREAMVWMQQEGQRDVVFETDSQALFHSIDQRQDDVSEFGLIVRSCLSFLFTFPQWKVCYVRRERNRVAHELARHSISQGLTTAGVYPPAWLSDDVNAFCVNLDHV